jgi:hypothetical protein
MFLTKNMVKKYIFLNIFVEAFIAHGTENIDKRSQVAG